MSLSPSSSRPLRLACAALAAAALVLPSRPARALQPLEEFLEHARTSNPDNRAAHAMVAEREGELSASTGSLWPNLEGDLAYTHNQYEVDTSNLFSLPAAQIQALESQLNPTIAKDISNLLSSMPNTIIQPQNQWDGKVQLTVPIIAVGLWEKRAAAKATLAGARADEMSARLAVAKGVTKVYFQLVGSEAVVGSALKLLEVAQKHVKLARDRKESGTGSELDVQRALAEEARATQALTGAQLNVTVLRRAMSTLSGLDPEPASPFPEDDLHDEGPLEGWMSGAAGHPSVKSAEASRTASEEATKAYKSLFLPTVAGIAEEKFTNATAFMGGHSDVYLLQLVATWKLDLTIQPQVKAQQAMTAAARAKEDKARRDAQDAVYNDWQQIHAGIEGARAARVQVDATRLAASLAEDRYQSGVATQLDVLQARQDAFSADVARIQADADLAYARAALRIDAGGWKSTPREVTQ